jgi:hypothetical protein
MTDQDHRLVGDIADGPNCFAVIERQLGLKLVDERTDGGTVVDVIESPLRKRVEVLLHRLQRRRNTTLLIVKGARSSRKNGSG